MPGPYYASYSERFTTPLYKIGTTKKLYVDNTDPYVKLISRKIIDVRKDFSWTVSPKHQILDKIPYCYLVEREQQQNSLISSALYYINAIASSSITEDIADKITSLLAKINPDSTTSGNDAKTKFNKLKTNIEKIAASANDKYILIDRLQSYIGMYFTQKTGFRYVLPYLSNSFIDQRNSWSQTQQNPGLLANLVTDTLIPFADTAVSTGNIMTPGTFIERPKYYNYPGEGETITITFPLLNTFTTNNYLPYVQNYELLWILSYQNKPYRTSFSRIMPPKLYTVYIPGVKFMPYAYISNLRVDFVGTKRRLELTLPTGDTVEAPIPEAYEVTLSITSLLADIGNLMVDASFTSDNIEVRKL